MAATGAARDFARALQTGRKAARAMWTRTRSAQVRGANETILEADAKRLAEWRAWLKRAVRQPEISWEATPVCGAWQLQFMVHNFAPAVQKVVVEQQQPDGTWRETAGRHTIEFRSYAARPRTKLKREFIVPVDSPAAELRITVHGVGQVAVSHLVLTNGPTISQTKNFRAKTLLGQRAPATGFPVIQTGAAAAPAGIRLHASRQKKGALVFTRAPLG